METRINTNSVSPWRLGDLDNAAYEQQASDCGPDTSLMTRAARHTQILLMLGSRQHNRYDEDKPSPDQLAFAPSAGPSLPEIQYGFQDRYEIAAAQPRRFPRRTVGRGRRKTLANDREAAMP